MPRLWDINKAASDPSGGVIVPFRQFTAADAGSFAVYLLNNYNRDIKGKMIHAGFDWSVTTSYDTRTTPANGAYAGSWFQDVASGPYDSNDYWWWLSRVDLNNEATP
jgi:hypothetical protein